MSKFNMYGRGSDLAKGSRRTKGASVSHTRMKDEKKPKWVLSDTGAIKTKVSFPKSNKTTVGRTKRLISKRKSVHTSTGRSSSVLL